MIDAKVSNGKVEIRQANGKTYKLMADLCCLVRAICEACWEDEEDGIEIAEYMILMTAKALTEVKPEKKNEETVF